MHSKYTRLTMDGLLAGKLSYVFLVSILDATALALVALLWFRHSVRTLMRRRGANAEAAAMDGTIQASIVRHRAFPTICHSLSSSAAAFSPPCSRAPPVRNRPYASLLIAYTLGAAAYSPVITTLQLTGQAPGLPWIAWLGRWWENMWTYVSTCLIE